MATAMLKHMPHAAGEKIHPDEFLTLTELVPVRADVALRNGMLTSANFMDVVKNQILIPVHKGEGFAGYPCMIEEQQLTSLTTWREWLTFISYINKYELAAYIVFENTRYVNGDDIVLACELRVYPRVSMVK